MNFKLLIFLLCVTFCYAAANLEQIKVYLIVSSRGGEYTIEKIYLKKTQIISKHNTTERLFMNFDIEEKSFNTHILLTILNFIEQSYNNEIKNPL